MRFSTANGLLRLWRHLSKDRRTQFVLLTSLMLLSAFAEIASLGAVLPFIGILVAPDKVLSHPLGSWLARLIDITTADQLVTPLTFAFCTAALVAGTIRIMLLWFSTRLAFACGADLGIEAYRRTLHQPYIVHVGRNSSEVISGIINKINSVVFLVLLPLLTLISSFLLLVAVIVVLIIIDPNLALVATLGFGGCYSFITWISRRRLHKNSQRISREQTLVIKSLQEGLGGIRDVLLNGSQSIYCDKYREADNSLRSAQSNNIFLSQSPRFIMEALGMVFIATLAYILSRQAGGIATALPVLGALALGAQRLLPTLQQGYNAWANIAGNRASLVDTLILLDQPMSVELLQATTPKYLFRESIHFQSVRFRYRNDGPWVLDGLNVQIKKGARVGFVGSTGSGKSTTLDLVMGLLIPTEGDILVDGKCLSGAHLTSWQRMIAHVPQSIYLADATIAENIAFGVLPSAIDFRRVRAAAHQAQISNFIESRSDGYQALVGERGVLLSGGQRQRIAIARALYKQASVLVFDEATSALDNATEQVVMDAIEGLSRDLTILVVAHRLSTVRRCDNIFELGGGKVVAEGTYDSLLSTSPNFYKMANQA